MDRQSLRPLLRRLQSAIGLVAIVFVAVLVSPQARDGSNIFLDPTNLTNIVVQVVDIGIMALAMTFVILTAGIDLSVGSLLALATVVVARLLTAWTPDLPLAMHLGLAMVVTMTLTAAVGALNGLLIAHLRIQPFIVTLASMIGVRGLAKWLTSNENVDLGFGADDAASVFADVMATKSVAIATYAALAVILAILLSKTVFGRYVRALGDNEKASLYTGLPVKWIQTGVYSLCGLAAGIAGCIHCAYIHQGNPNTGTAYELDVIAAVVIGGTSLAGGRGTIAGTVVGTLIMGVLNNILTLRGIDENVRLIVKAGIIVAAVWLQRERRAGV